MEKIRVAVKGGGIHVFLNTGGKGRKKEMRVTKGE